MNRDDRQRFAHLLTDVLGFYGQTPSVFALDVWWRACKPFEFEVVQRALSRHATDPERGQFAPKPGDLIRHLQGTPTDRAARAWSITLDACSRVGAYCDVVFDDPIVHAVIDDMGGWPALCRTETDRLSYTQHRFTEAYRAYIHRDDLREWPAKLCGDRSPDEIYLQRGLPPPKPVLVGDAAKARAVLQKGGATRHALTTIDDAVGQFVELIENREDAA